MNFTVVRTWNISNWLPTFSLGVKTSILLQVQGLGPWTDAAMNRKFWDQHCESFIEFCCT